jgi:hypothetical protein
MAKTWGSERSRRTGVVVALILLLAPPALAQDDRQRNAARELAEQGATAMERGDYATAQDLYRRAYALVPAPTLSLRRARALVKLGRLVEAVEAYVRTTRTQVTPSSPSVFRDSVQQANDELVALRPRVPKLTVMVENGDPKAPGSSLTLDGKPFSPALVGVSSPADPGKHALRMTTGDGREASANATLAEGETKTVTLKLMPAEAGAEAPEAPATAPRVEPAPDQGAPPSTSSTQKTLAFVSLGVGAAGLGVGVVTGLLASSKHSSAESACPDGHCVAGSAGASDVDSFRRLRTISTVGYIVGAVGIGAGVTLWLTAPKRAETARVGAFLGVASAGVKGAF